MAGVYIVQTGSGKMRNTKKKVFGDEGHSIPRLSEQVRLTGVGRHQTGSGFRFPQIFSHLFLLRYCFSYQATLSNASIVSFVCHIIFSVGVSKESEL